jgi:hypothetical protein
MTDESMPEWIAEGRRVAQNETPPPWRARHDRDRERVAKLMVEWVNARLDQWDNGLWEPSDTVWLSNEEAFRAGEQIRAKIAKAAQRDEQWRRGGGLELQAAKEGNIKPLRALVRKLLIADGRNPALGDFVQLKPLAKGQRRDPVKIGGVPVPHADKRQSGYWVREAERRKKITEAAADVDRIRILWREFFGKTNRRKGDGPTALDIAAERHGVTPDEIALFLKS